MLDDLKREVCEANLELVRRGLVIYTWGNASSVDRERDLMVIKPSGVDYGNMRPNDMVVVRLQDGSVVEGNLRPSSDTPTHLELYRAFPAIGGIVHTHSMNATAFAQAGMPIRILGTTQADTFFGDVPCTRQLSEWEVAEAYEQNTGRVIIETFEEVDHLAVPGVLVRNHGPFTWGNSVTEAVYNAVTLEYLADMNQKTLALNPRAALPSYVMKKHYLRKHGQDSYYGQLK